MTIDRRHRLILVFMFLFAFKAGFHSVTQIFQGPIWGGILLGIVYGFAATWLMLIMIRVSNPPRSRLRKSIEYDWPLDPLHKEYLEKFDVELSSILHRNRLTRGC